MDKKPSGQRQEIRLLQGLFPGMAAVAADTDDDGLVFDRLAVSPLGIF
jgi:hypothetical protein